MYRVDNGRRTRAVWTRYGRRRYVRQRGTDAGSQFREPFYSPASQSRLYEVPKGTGANPIFNVGLWIAGARDNVAHSAITSYIDTDFWIGPLGPNGRPVVNCRDYDRIWSVSDADIREYELTGTLPANMADWPWRSGAPVHRGDNAYSDYDPGAGDRPLVYGDHVLWWVMNDYTLRPELFSNTRGRSPLPVEVAVAAFASNGLCQMKGHPFEREIAAALSTTTFYRYEIRYRGDQSLDSAYIGFLVDADLGDAGDDYMGSDPGRSLGFVYNATDIDGNYGHLIPGVGTIVRASGPDGSPIKMAALTWHGTDFQPGLPPYIADDSNAHLQTLRGRFFNGTRMREIGYGLPLDAGDHLFTTYLFSGDPPAFWSEEDIDGLGTRSQPGDRRYVQSVGPMTLTKGDTAIVDLAIIWAGPSDRLTSVSLLKETASRILSVWDDVLVFDTRDCRYQPPEQPTVLDHQFALGIYPNPAAEHVTFEFEISGPGQVRISVVDVLGRRVAMPVNDSYEPGRHRVAVMMSTLGPGVYSAQIETNGRLGARPFVIAR